jgi:predicted metal-dependent phosphoesterase TrpH
MSKKNIVMKPDSLVLKADLHIHTNEDPKDSKEIEYNSSQLIDYLDKKDFDVFSITLHEGVLNDDRITQVRKYAKDKGMIYIPGIEQEVDGKHLVILNMNSKEVVTIKNYDSLKRILKNHVNIINPVLVIAPHPYYPFGKAAGKKVDEWSKYIDCIEYNSFYLRYLNFNWRAERKAKELRKPLIGNTDAHTLENIGYTYTEIIIPKIPKQIKQNFQSKKLKEKKVSFNKSTFKKYVKNCTEKEYQELINGIIYLIKNNNIRLQTKPLSITKVLKALIKFR